jgi:hypothetical protein
MSKFNTQYSPGDVVYTIIPPNKYQGTGWLVAPEQITIGRVRVEMTDTPGNGDPDEIFDNYKPQKSYEESYMAVETGIGSGRVYPQGWLFFTKDLADDFANNQTMRWPHESIAGYHPADPGKRLFHAGDFVPLFDLAKG